MFVKKAEQQQQKNKTFLVVQSRTWTNSQHKYYEQHLNNLSETMAETFLIVIHALFP